MFNVWTWPRETVVGFLGNTGNLDPTETWVPSF